MHSKRLLLILVMGISGLTGYSQDLIVTNNNDSINCKITKVKADYIYFVFQYKANTKSTLLPVASVKTYSYNYFISSPNAESDIPGYKDYSTFKIGLHGGYSHWLASIPNNTPSDFKQYLKDLKSGGNFNADITFYFTEQLGAGVKYANFITNNSEESIYITDNNGTRYGRMSDNITIQFVGPMFSSRSLNKSKNTCFYGNISLGMIQYNNHFVLIDRYEMSGTTIGYLSEIGYDIGISKEISLGFLLSYVSGKLYYYQISDGVRTEFIQLEPGDENVISTSSLNFSVSLSIHL